MARQIQRYEVTLIGEVCPSDNGRWCLWEDVAPVTVEENGSSHNSESAPCEVADSCPVKRCRECRRYYDDLYELT